MCAVIRGEFVRACECVHTQMSVCVIHKIQQACQRVCMRLRHVYRIFVCVNMWVRGLCVYACTCVYI